MAKSVAITLLAGYAWLRLRLVKRPVLLILTYHRVLPADSPERAAEQPGMVISPDALDKHIRLVRAWGAEPIHLNDWLERNRLGKALPRLSVAFTFDDGWRDNYEHAYPLLKAHNVPATIFLVTRMIGSNQTFWPEQILRLLTTTVIPPHDPAFDWLRSYLPNDIGQRTSPLSLLEADAVINRLKSMDDRTILDAINKLFEAHPDYLPASHQRAILNQDELTDMAADGVVTYGAHTRHHYRLNRLQDDGVLQDEIVESLWDIQSAIPAAAVPIFCYPNGDITGKGESLVAEYFSAACTTKTGWNPAGCDPYDLHRVNLHDGNSSKTLQLLASIGRGLL